MARTKETSRKPASGDRKKPYTIISETEKQAFDAFLAERAQRAVLQKARMLCLPLETLILIIELAAFLQDYVLLMLDQLPQQAQINLAKTCRTLHRAVMPILYEECEFPISAATPFSPQVESFLRNLSHGLQHTRRLKLTCSYQPCFDEESRDFVTAEDVLELPEEAQDVRANLVNSVGRALFRQVPPKKLASLEWLHQLPISTRTLNEVVKNHRKTLTTLRFSRIHRHSDNETVECPKRLQELACSTISEHYHMIATFILHNRKTLRKLRLGQEWPAYAVHHPSGMGPSGAVSRNALDEIADTLQYKFSGASDKDGPLDVLGLDTFELINLDITLTANPDDPITSQWAWLRLRRLALESCTNNAEVLRELAKTFRLTQENENAVGLQEFVYRDEAANETVCQELRGFLQCFSGLRLLSVLLDGYDKPFDPDDEMLKSHGETLKVFVWEARSGPRYSPDFHHTSMYSRHLEFNASPLARICATCPNLVELSLVAPCYNLLPHYGGFVGNAGPILAHKLPKLRTFHMRNAVEIMDDGDLWYEEESHDSGTWQMEMAQRCLAIDLAQEIAGETPKTKLDLILIGPHRYKEHWHVDCDGAEEANACEVFQRVSCFDVEYVWSSKKGHQVAHVEQVNQGRPVDELQSANIRCLESYWIR